ncbi:TPM domain-containing protein [Lederbergia sp. NSJ-179]|uniref:TPM domain-containing protein n=1 Tax=Lederbergia sp. NSJ-179 TaxID=2931402 RepID=UPI001FD4F237|nr:TPM domain-containing protein [Lederbergia sp. NSJ-179]MCJ7841177.1 TPM domain-containing protein [Lederbergia sp. NSJ-179]
MKKITYFIVLIPLLFFSVTQVLAADIPDPRGDIYAQDFADLLPTKVQEELIELGSYLDEQTGAQLSVLTIPSLKSVPIKDYAEEAFRKYQLGNQDQQNGVLLLFVVQERKIYIEIGKGLEERFSGGKIGKILDTYTLPFLEKNDFEQAITNTYNKLFNELAVEYDLDKRAEAKAYEYGYQNRTGLSILTIMIVVLFFLGMIFLDFKFLGGALSLAILRVFTTIIRRRRKNKRKSHKRENKQRIRTRYRR